VTAANGWDVALRRVVFARVAAAAHMIGFWGR
jgi:hypothetical protein